MLRATPFRQVRSLHNAAPPRLWLPAGAGCSAHRRRRNVAAPTAALQQQVLSAAAGGLHTVSSAVQGSTRLVAANIDPVVLGSTASASFKLFLICAAVGWLLKTRRIPNDTASVLSQVSFQLLIPCMLFSKVAATLAGQPDTALLLGMAVAAVVQITIGAAWGMLLSPLVDGSYSRNIRIFGWNPLGPKRSAAAIASATAAATGVPHAAAALLPRAKPAPQGTRELVAAACSFGNSFTLPAVFFLSLLPGVLADKAIAYCGLYLLAWSPCLWSGGFTLVEGGFSKAKHPQQAAARRSPWQQQLDEQQRERDQPQEPSRSSATASPSLTNQEAVFDIGSEDVTAVPEPAQAPPNGLLQRLLHHPSTPTLVQFIRRTLNPPVLAILVGMAVGLSPAGRALFLGGAPGVAASNAAALPFELGLVRAALKCGLEVIELLAGGTLAMQTLVLASSLLQQTQGEDAPPPKLQPAGSAGARQRGWLAAARHALSPVDAVEARALAVLAAVRFVLLPCTALAVFRWASAAGLLGSLAADPVFLFVIAVQCVMPSAQNLIIMLQLSDVTRPAAPAFARLLLKLYAYAVLPVTLWVTAFASCLAIPLT